MLQMTDVEREKKFVEPSDQSRRARCTAQSYLLRRATKSVDRTFSASAADPDLPALGRVNGEAPRRSHTDLVDHCYQLLAVSQAVG